MTQLLDLEVAVVPLSRNGNISNEVMNNFLVVKSVIIGLNYCFWKSVILKKLQTKLVRD